MRKCVHLGTKLASFESAADSVTEILEVKLNTKRIERLTKRTGLERVHERDVSITEWEALPLVAKLDALTARFDAELSAMNAPEVWRGTKQGFMARLDQPPVAPPKKGRARAGS